MNKKAQRLPKARTNNIVVSELKDELLLYCLDTHQAYCLNKTAAAVYQSADGIKSAGDIAAALSKELKSNVTENFVLFSLDELKSKNLVEFSSPDQAKYNLTSRREAIRKIGLSTAIALPLITMLVAPKAADAQSSTCGADGDACIPSGNLPFTQDSCCTGLVCCGNGVCGTICGV